MTKYYIVINAWLSNVSVSSDDFQFSASTIINSFVKLFDEIKIWTYMKNQCISRYFQSEQMFLSRSLVSLHCLIYTD